MTRFYLKATFSANGEQDVVIELNNGNEWENTATLKRGVTYNVSYSTDTPEIITNIATTDVTEGITDAGCI